MMRYVLVMIAITANEPRPIDCTACVFSLPERCEEAKATLVRRFTDKKIEVIAQCIDRGPAV